MYATFRWYPDESLADVLAARADEVRAVISEVPGFSSYSIVRTDGGTVTVTVCADEEGTAESTRRAAAWLRENLADLDVPSPNVSAGPVVLHF